MSNYILRNLPKNKDSNNDIDAPIIKERLEIVADVIIQDGKAYRLAGTITKESLTQELANQKIITKDSQQKEADLQAQISEFDNQ